MNYYIWGVCILKSLVLFVHRDCLKSKISTRGNWKYTGVFKFLFNSDSERGNNCALPVFLWLCNNYKHRWFEGKLNNSTHIKTGSLTVATTPYHPVSLAKLSPAVTCKLSVWSSCGVIRTPVGHSCTEPPYLGSPSILFLLLLSCFWVRAGRFHPPQPLPLDGCRQNVEDLLRGSGPTPNLLSGSSPGWHLPQGLG